MEDMLRGCIIDFRGSWEDFLPLTEFSYNNSYQASIRMAPYEALYGRKCRTPICWTELYDRNILGPDLIQQTEKIVSPWKKVLRFGQKGKLSPRFIGPYRILERVGLVAYRLELPPQLSRIHNVFHVSMLRQYRPNPRHIIQVQDVELRPNLSYDEEPVQILDQDERILRNRRIPMVKVQWSNQSPSEATWEIEESMREQFPHLFPSDFFPHRLKLPPNPSPTSSAPFCPPLTPSEPPHSPVQNPYNLSLYRSTVSHGNQFKAPIGNPLFWVVSPPFGVRLPFRYRQQLPGALATRTVPFPCPFVVVSGFAGVSIEASDSSFSTVFGGHKRQVKLKSGIFGLFQLISFRFERFSGLNGHAWPLRAAPVEFQPPQSQP
ncbi:hypothetical protein V6N12_034632 [Hibiscus sabdariffa]|uniref:Tf2-1-like SH3-like domain-containing protein n=1 Tax=Hibiscus sabdariffa TaxID=183260 RepID=A0ABR2DIX0_9ROSI